jgi:hypothetical protein
VGVLTAEMTDVGVADERHCLQAFHETVFYLVSVMLKSELMLFDGCPIVGRGFVLQPCYSTLVGHLMVVPPATVNALPPVLTISLLVCVAPGEVIAMQEWLCTRVPTMESVPIVESRGKLVEP